MYLLAAFVRKSIFGRPADPLAVPVAEYAAELAWRDALIDHLETENLRLRLLLDAAGVNP